jgi:hypothetical protein
MALDEIGEAGGGEFPISAACLPNFDCVPGTKKCFFEFLVRNFPMQPLTSSSWFAVCPSHGVGSMDQANLMQETSSTRVN